MVYYSTWSPNQYVYSSSQCLLLWREWGSSIHWQNFKSFYDCLYLGASLTQIKRSLLDVMPVSLA